MAIVKDLFILEIDKLNKKNRIYPRIIIDQWIDNLRNLNPSYYKIEYTGKLNIDNFKTEYIRQNLYCGIVNDIFYVDNNVYGSIKLMPNHPLLTDIYKDETILEDMVLSPKSLCMIHKNEMKISELIGFNLIFKKQSPFL